ncbi:hypothetical protein BCR37DRAFT_339847, partial [Protomyces lactucae-debilis]
HCTAHKDTPKPPPFFLGLTGLQGSGKSYLVELLERHFSGPSTKLKRLHATTAGSLHVVAYSLDDLYLPLSERQKLAESSGNALWRVRGQFGTHDTTWAQGIVGSLRAQAAQTKIPRFDKAVADGQGDRVSQAAWQVVDTTTRELVDLVLFEGWSVGMRPLGEAGLAARLETLRTVDDAHAQAKYHALQDLVQVDTALSTYLSWMGPLQPLQALLVLEAEQVGYVYTWRLQQEHALRLQRDGQGMSDAEVVAFIDTYYPAYELY